MLIANVELIFVSSISKPSLSEHKSKSWQLLIAIVCALCKVFAKAHYCRESGGGSLRNIITVLRDICWPLISRGWGSESSDWLVPESRRITEGIFHVSSALQLPISTFNQVSSIWWSHLYTIIISGVVCQPTLKHIFVLNIMITWASPSWRVSRYLCWNYSWFVLILNMALFWEKDIKMFV